LEEIEVENIEVEGGVDTENLETETIERTSYPTEYPTGSPILAGSSNMF
jgi:hypothetical protein